MYDYIKEVTDSVWEFVSLFEGHYAKSYLTFGILWAFF